MENAIIVRWLDVIKAEVDFSNFDAIKDAINAKKLYTIHTQVTQELSDSLGIHLMGYVDGEGNDINNDRACALSGYDYIGSMLLLCKTDDKYNPLPFTPEEIEKVYDFFMMVEQEMDVDDFDDMEPINFDGEEEESAPEPELEPEPVEEEDKVLFKTDRDSDDEVLYKADNKEEEDEVLYKADK